VVKELAADSLDLMVPSMLLQPLVENSIKHGLASKVEGGSIHLRSRLSDSGLVIEVEDDGVWNGGNPDAGMPEVREERESAWLIFPSGSRFCMAIRRG